MTTSPDNSGTRTFIGTAGWSYPDWDGFVYPRGFGGERLPYVIKFVDLVEINTTFYRPVDPRNSEIWAQKALEARADFIFTVKLWQRFTHERGAIEPMDARNFLDGIAPLVEAKIMGAILMQFPWSFRQTEENMLHLERLREKFWSLPLAVEVRHASWDNPEFLSFLADRKMAFVNIDQPIVGDSLRPSSHVTASFAYVRMHGRNEEDWFRNDADRDERYDYLYNTGQLKEWTSRLAQIKKSASCTYVVMNNHYKGQALANAIEMKHLVSGNKVAVPEPLFHPYPRMASIAGNPPAQFELFA